MRWLSALLILILVVGIALTALPARLIPLFVGDQILLSGVSGSIWSGQAARAVVPTPTGPFHLGQLRWTLSPLSLLRLSPTIDAQSQWGAQRMQAQATFKAREVHLSDVDAFIDASLLRQFAPVDVSGRFSLLLDELVFAQQLISVDGRLTWQEATWFSASNQYRLGSYVAQFSSPEPRQVQATVDTISGPLQVRGDASLADGRYVTELMIGNGGGEVPAEIAQALSLIAVPQDSGYLLRLEGDVQ